MSDDIPRSMSQSTLHIMGVALVVHHLEDGRRIIESDGMNALFARMSDGVELTPDDADAIAKVLRP